MRAVDPVERALESRVTRFEWVTETTLAVGVVAVTALLAVLSDHVVSPYAAAAFPSGDAAAGVDPVVVGVTLLAVVFLPILAVSAWRRGGFDQADFYAGGRSTRPDHAMGAALGATRSVTLRGYYLDDVVDGALLFRAGSLVCGLALVAMAVVGWVVAA